MIEDPHTKPMIGHAAVIKVPAVKNDGIATYGIDNSVDRLLPFQVRRVFYIFDTPSHAFRGGHSHFESHELIVALHGSFTVELYDGDRRLSQRLNKPNEGLFVPPGIWREMTEFTRGAVCMVLSSIEYSEDDYVRDYRKFLELTSCKRPWLPRKDIRF